ncbi:hypothetical protein B7P43_G13568 [Cryptotermes secundus]|uniref:Uncharacterized protein n=2 Tax=Cryptotermes secundus TaxID=105785 RepID=A0A2J7PPW1_9NEOP|nr:adhesive plaque matrix protein [Cryptotermes secundus]XP_023722373.1 adhesive plaque matrix protein [Cryptotermes secundus]PNF18370.1 hypothetical protein B7P43_G13568 [Cryptotermes secundus]
MNSMFLPVILATLVAAAGSTLDHNLDKPTSEELHVVAATYNNRRPTPRQQIVYDNGKHSRLPEHSRVKQGVGLRLSSNKADTVHAENASLSDVAPNTARRRDPKDSEPDGMLMASAGRRNTNKSKQGDDDDGDEDKKTLSQQIAEGKYGLIEKEIYATTPKRPGIISYASNPEVPRDTAKNLGGLEPEEIWLAENHLLVLRGGFFPEHKFNRTDDSDTVWPPIDDFNAPRRQVKIPANPKIPPPFPVQLTDDGPTQFIGFNGTAGRPPFPPFFPQPPPRNGSYFAPPFPFPPPGNFTPEFYPPIPPGNFSPGGGFYPPPGNGSFSLPQFPYPLPPPGNGSYFGPPPGNFTPGSEPFYPPPFPGFPPLPFNATYYPPYPLPPPLPPNATLPFPPPFLNLPPGAAFLPPPGNLTVPFDEDDPSLYYPPPYDFYYPRDNSTEVPPGPLVPGIILPPPPNFFAPLNNNSEEHSEHHPTSPPPTTTPPVADTPAPPYGRYLPALSRPLPAKNRRPSLGYTPITTEIRKKKPFPTASIVDNEALNHITPDAETYVLTTPAPEIQKLDQYSEKPPRPPISIAPQIVHVTHKGKSPIEQIPQQGYYYEKPAIPFTQAPENVYSNIHNVILTTAVPDVSYYTVPLTDIVVRPTPRLQHTKNASNQNTPVQPPKTYYQPGPITEESPTNQGQGINIPTTTVAPHLIYYNSQQQPLDTETNTVTPSPQPYNLKTKSGARVTVLPPLSYHTVPSVSKQRNPASVKTSYYFYEEPNEGSRYVSDPPSPVTTQAPPSKYEEPVRYYNEEVSTTPQPFYSYNVPPIGGKSTSPKVQLQQYVYSNVLPVGQSVEGISQTEQPQQYVYSDALPAETPGKSPPQTVHSQVYSIAAPVKGSTQAEQYIYSSIAPASQAKGVRTRPQSYVVSSALPVDQQVIFSSGTGKFAQSSTPAPPQYYYVTVSPGIQYEAVGSAAPSTVNQKFPTQPPQQELIKSTPQPIPLVPKLVYYTTPRTNFAYHDTSSQRPIIYNIQPSPSPRPTYQYSYDTNGNNVETQPRQQNIYTTIRTKSRKPQRPNYQGDSQGAIVSPVQYQSTPRTLFEYNYEQSTKAPDIQHFYPAPQYNVQKDVPAGSPTAHYGYEDVSEQSKQRYEYQSTPQPRFRGRQRPQVPQVNIYPTANPFHAYFTRQDETLLDDITKKYFTIFGQKLPSGDENVPTTPIPAYTKGNVQSQSKRPYVANGERQYYTTPIPNYNIQKSENPPESDQVSKVPVSLADDININYKKPSPPVNPLSEFIDTRQLSNLQPGGALVSYKFPGDGGHFYFITPQVVGAEQPQQQANGYLYSPPNQAPPQLVTYRRKKRKEQR